MRLLEKKLFMGKLLP